MTIDSHVRFQAGLAALLAELLPPEESAWMMAHAGACAECSGLLSRGRTRLEELAADGVHVPKRMLTSFLLESAELTPLERELVGRHLAACDDCRKDMEEMARAAGVPPRMKAPGASGGGWGTKSMLGLLIAVGLLATLFVLQPTRHPPRTSSAPPIAAVPSPTSQGALGGEQPFLVFHERTRGPIRPAPTSDTLGSGITSIRVQLPALFLERDSDVLVTVSSATGNEVARDTLPSRALDRPFELTATIGPWNAGDYVLTVSPSAGRDRTATRVFEFRLIAKP